MTGRAIEWPDGWGLHVVNGVRVPDWIIERPAEITPAKIDAEANSEVRRVMMERYGLARYLKDGNAKLLNEDRDIYDRPRKLWHKEIPGDEPLVMVEVINSTPEPDGHSKVYTLRVPPNIATVQQAIAWTFGMKPEEYRTRIET